MKWSELRRRFHAWQLKPHEVAPLSEEEHDCSTCKTHYVGNYCPRCGQSSKIGRYSFKKAFMLFLDVWGLGNRGMFRSLRDLVLRPGYMIRDYLGGMQMAYFPPFKMFFLLATFSLLITHGLNVGLVNTSKETRQAFQERVEASDDDNTTEYTENTSNLTADQQAKELFRTRLRKVVDSIFSLQEKYPNLFALAWLIFLSGFFYIFFRKSPAIPGLRYSEFLVAMVYIANMVSIYSIICDFFCLSDSLELLSWLMVPVALKQLSGFSMKRTLWAAFIPSLLLFVLSLVAITAFVFLIAKQSGMMNYLSEEEQRMEKISRIDSTSIRTFLAPDTIEGWEQLSSLTAEAWILVEDSSGLLISEKNADRRMYPASLTKMMTCLLALEHGPMSDTIVITDDVCVTHDARVKSGDSYEKGNLIREMMMLSDNVAAYALGKHVGGDTLAFCKMMNQKASYLGMDSTHFANPNGLPNDSNYSTARDLLTLARYSMCDTLFAQIVGTDSMDIVLTDGRHMPCKNTNRLLASYPGCLGVKTGYTRKAGSCLASAATRNGTTLFLILLNSKNYSTRFDESTTLLDYGFRVMEAYRQNKGASE